MSSAMTVSVCVPVAHNVTDGGSSHPETPSCQYNDSPDGPNNSISGVRT